MKFIKKTESNRNKEISGFSEKYIIYAFYTYITCIPDKGVLELIIQVWLENIKNL